MDNYKLLDFKGVVYGLLLLFKLLGKGDYGLDYLGVKFKYDDDDDDDEGGLVKWFLGKLFLLLDYEYVKLLFEYY